MPLSTKIIRVPVKLVDGHWELLYGGAVKVKDGALGDLHLDRSAFSDRHFLKALTEKRAVRVLPQGTELRVALTVKSGLPDRLLAELLPHDATRHSHTVRLAAESKFVSVRLGGPTAQQIRKEQSEGGLTLCLEGMEARYLESSLVNLPGGLMPVDSLNHAFTRLSELFEPWRKSHTGNVYERFFYKEENGIWYPLDDLRCRELVSAERQIIQRLWDDVARQLGAALF
ncbi:hypothetical protein PE066_04430 [Ramlibacter tataouinensis]|uniref:hypothetical protein n=1 Tax=Ramlibacter tataouinensis TaxID=94132 RepID=UPI0022F3E0AD|nr:hypothetical protein [Ramlibacter tataouinensis]WBY02792.1 hypothetical protein PE066_04430 [Ramlibacter tataouinensis]